jgi:pyruvate/2-oxoglutarate/acetoin dehydrogenase E1 component
MLGAGNGAALAGARPIVEAQLMDFSMYAMDQLVNVTAKQRYVSGGRVSLPLVFRTRVNDRGSQHGATHMQSLEALFYHVPGLKIVMPSNAADAKGLITSAIRDDDPVVFIECAALDRARVPVPAGEHVVPIGSARVVRAGTDVSVVAFGHTVGPALRVAGDLAGEGIEVEVVDLRTLAPLDVETILESVRRTGRLVVFQQASVQGGIGSDICRIVAAEAWSELTGPPLVVGSRHAPVPYSPPLERAVLYDSDELRAAVLRLLGRDKPPPR